jgi:hypothetical protein
LVFIQNISCSEDTPRRVSSPAHRPFLCPAVSFTPLYCVLWYGMHSQLTKLMSQNHCRPPWLSYVRWRQSNKQWKAKRIEKDWRLFCKWFASIDAILKNMTDEQHEPCLISFSA